MVIGSHDFRDLWHLSNDHTHLRCCVWQCKPVVPGSFIGCQCKECLLLQGLRFTYQDGQTVSFLLRRTRNKHKYSRIVEEYVVSDLDRVLEDCVVSQIDLTCPPDGTVSQRYIEKRSTWYTDILGICNKQRSWCSATKFRYATTATRMTHNSRGVYLKSRSSKQEGTIAHRSISNITILLHAYM